SPVRLSHSRGLDLKFWICAPEWRRTIDGETAILNIRALCLALLTAALPAAAGHTLLFVDDHDVLYRSGTRRVLHPAQRHPANPLIRPERPWEGAIGWSSIHRDEAGGKYQLWYQAYSAGVSQKRTHDSVVCYAESADGVHFVKPNLGLFQYNGIRDTNIVLIGNGGFGDRYTNSVLVDHRDPDPAHRYKMIFYDWFLESGREYPGLQLAFSPDGIHWTKRAGGVLLKTLYGGLGQPPPFAGEDPVFEEPGRGRARRSWRMPMTMSDAVDLMFDPRRQVYALYGKMWMDGPTGGLAWKHGMGRTESRNLIDWSRPELLLSPDDDDDRHVEFHTCPVFFYHDRYFALGQVLRKAPAMMIDIELMLSQDGIHWERPFRQPYFLPRNPLPDSFDSGSIFTNATPIVSGREMRFYWGAYSGPAVGGTDRNLRSGGGLATIPLDRFAGIRPVELSDQRMLRTAIRNQGQVTLRPIDLSEVGRITLNADASQGSMRVELLDEFEHSVRWTGPASTLPARRVLIRIHLDNAELFALTLNGAGPR
ncbi:MAG: hypothetical protein NTY38_20020, partial [Acidobacteria bacterium]|nr:hypothetical protein [Acidobacteriota bacterium]